MLQGEGRHAHRCQRRQQGLGGLIGLAFLCDGPGQSSAFVIELGEGFVLGVGLTSLLDQRPDAAHHVGGRSTGPNDLRSLLLAQPLSRCVIVEGPTHGVAQFLVSAVGDEAVAGDLDLEVLAIFPLLLGSRPCFPPRIDVDHAEQPALGWQVVQSTPHLQLFRQQIRSVAAMGVIELDAQPVLLNAVVGKSEARVVDQNAAKALKVVASVLHLDPACLTAREVEDLDLPFRGIDDGRDLELLGVTLAGAEGNAHMRVRPAALLHQLASYGRHVILQCPVHLLLERVFNGSHGRLQLDAEVVGRIARSGQSSIASHRRLEHPELQAQVADVFGFPALLEPPQGNSGAVGSLLRELQWVPISPVICLRFS